MIKHKIDEVLTEHQDKIVELAATMLAEKLVRTKVVKEKAASVAEAVLMEA